MRRTVSSWTCAAALSAALAVTSMTGCYSGGGWSMPRLSSLNPMSWGKSRAGASLASNDKYPPSPSITMDPASPSGAVAGGAPVGGGAPGGYPNTPYGVNGYPTQPAGGYSTGDSYATGGGAPSGGVQNGFYGGTADRRNAPNYSAPNAGPTGGYGNMPPGGAPQGAVPPGGMMPPSGAPSNYGTPYSPTGSPQQYGAPNTGGGMPNTGYPQANDRGQNYGGTSYDSGPGAYGGGGDAGGGSTYGGSTYGGGAYGGGSNSGSTDYNGGSANGGGYGGGSYGGTTNPPGFGAHDSSPADTGAGGIAGMNMPASLTQRGGNYAPGSIRSTQVASASVGGPTAFNRTETGDSPANMSGSGSYSPPSAQPGFGLPAYR